MNDEILHKTIDEGHHKKGSLILFLANYHAVSTLPTEGYCMFVSWVDKSTEITPLEG